MKPSVFPKFILAFFISTCLIYSCKDDDPIEEVCCSTETATNADFEFLYRVSGQDTIYWIPPLDTVYNGTSGSSKLYFRAKSSKMDSYEWKVGTDPTIFTDSLFFLTFGGVTGTVDVTLNTTKNDVNLECFPEDTGIAAVTKSIEFKTYSLNTDLPIYGKYEGAYEDNPNTIFKIEIGFYPGSNIQVVYNFPYQCTWFDIMRIITTGGRSFIYDEKINYQCGDPSGGGWLEEGNQTLIIEYTVDDIDDPTKRISKRFVGQRI